MIKNKRMTLQVQFAVLSNALWSFPPQLHYPYSNLNRWDLYTLLRCSVLQSLACIRSVIPRDTRVLTGSLKTYVSSAKKPYKRDYILQKRPTYFFSISKSHDSVMTLACKLIFNTKTTHISAKWVARAKKALEKRLYSAKETYIFHKDAYDGQDWGLTPEALPYDMATQHIATLQHTLQHTATHCTRADSWL